MPAGYFVRREAPHFKPKVNGKYLHMYAWMDKIMQERGVHIAHKLNTGKEHRIGPYFCDGYDAANKTVYEFDGCYFHGHQCRLTVNAWKKDAKKMEKKQQHTKDKLEYLKSQGYQVVVMQECQYEQKQFGCVSAPLLPAPQEWFGRDPNFGGCEKWQAVWHG